MSGFLFIVAIIIAVPAIAGAAVWGLCRLDDYLTDRFGGPR